MKGLIIKDFGNLAQQAKVTVFILILWVWMAISNGNASFFGGMICVYAALLPITAMAYDERGHWQIYETALPVSRKTSALEKYVLAGIFLVAGFIISFAVCLFSKMAVAEALMTSCAFLLISVLAVDVTLPLIFKFGVEKGRFIMMATFMLFAILPMLVMRAGAMPEVSIPAGAVIGIAVCVIALLTVLSMLLSVRIYEKKEF